MKNKNNCPICYEELTVVETTPCMVCGTDEHKKEVLKQDIKENFMHDSIEYHIYRAFDEIECSLCVVCTLDFCSYNPEFFGFEKHEKLGPENFQFLNTIDHPVISKDKFCKNCNMRLAFLKFIAEVRKIKCIKNIN